MNRIAWQLLRTGGWGRPALIAVSTALATGIVLVAATWTLLPADSPEVFTVISEPGTRVGAVFGALLVALAPLLLLDQVVRLGTAARERRQAALRLAGATPREVARLGLLEVGLPATVGALLGPIVPLLLGTARGATYTDDFMGTAISAQIVPTDPLPDLPIAMMIIAAVATAAVLVSSRASRRVSVSPLGVSRRQRRPDPRPWPLLLIPAGFALATVGYVALFDMLGNLGSSLAGIGSVLLIVLGLLLSAPWLAWRAGRRAERRARTATALVAARHLVSDPRPAGRAGSALAAVFLVLGGSVGIVFDLMGIGPGNGSSGGIDTYYLIGLAMVGFGLSMAFIVAVGSLAVHSVESLTDRRRSVAAMIALGTPRSDLSEIRRAEIRLVAVPLAAVGSILGCGVMTFASSGDLLLTIGATAATAVVSLALVWAASHAAVLLTSPWTRDAGAPAHLRTA